MSDAPVYDIDPTAFAEDPYPDLKRMRRHFPIAFVPQLGATLITRRNGIFVNEKKVDVFSSDQPDGLMTLLMGQNMMRKDGPSHQADRKAIFPTVSPKTVRDVWKGQFISSTSRILDRIAPARHADLVADIARPISGEALKAMTGLTNMTWQEMDRVSQGMIDGCANYAGDALVESNCWKCTASIDEHIDTRIIELNRSPDSSMLSVMMQAGLPESAIRANIKLVISGGQNEPRDAISGAAWAILTHPDQFAMVRCGAATWLQVFEEYARWVSPIGMSPRRVTKKFKTEGVTFDPEDRVFLMFGSGNRDETVFMHPDDFDITQDIKAAISFGAGPHFCAGAWASRCLIAEVALPMIFNRLPELRLDGNTTFRGWAFRGPVSVPVAW